MATVEQHYDEEIFVEDDDDDDDSGTGSHSNSASPIAGASTVTEQQINSAEVERDSDDADEEDDGADNEGDDSGGSFGATAMYSPTPTSMNPSYSVSATDGGARQKPVAERLDGPGAFADDEDIAALWEYVRQYKPRDISIDTPLKPFVPEYVPSVGDVDDFVKIPRPDNHDDGLGLHVLDEPAGVQSDPSVLQLKLRRAGVEGAPVEDVAGVLTNDASSQRRLDNWITSVEQMHEATAPSEVTYSGKMPQLDALMQEWPPEVEQVVRNMQMPDASIDLDLQTLASTLCSALGIPVYSNVCESLHMLYSLYYEMQTNTADDQHHLGVSDAATVTASEPK